MNSEFPPGPCGSLPHEAIHSARYTVRSTYFRSSPLSKVQSLTSPTNTLSRTKERQFLDELHTEHLNSTCFFGKKVAPAPKPTIIATAENTGDKTGAQQLTPQSGKKLSLPKRKDVSSASTPEIPPSSKKTKAIVKGGVSPVSEQAAPSFTERPSVSNSTIGGHGHPSRAEVPRCTNVQDPSDVPMCLDEDYALVSPSSLASNASRAKVEGHDNGGSSQIIGKEALMGQGIASRGQLVACSSIYYTPTEISAKGLLTGSTVECGNRSDGMATASSSGQCHTTPLSDLKKAQEQGGGELWTSKYRPRSAADLVGNFQVIARLREWLIRWDSNCQPKATGGSFGRGRGKPMDEPKKAVLMSGPPGIGKTSSATILCQELGYEIVEVNASDSRGKADGEIKQGVAGRTSNKIKELITNQCMVFDRGASISSKKMVLIMDEVDGMSGGDRGGIQDLIKSIKTTKIPIICICNDRYNRKLQSLVNNCLDLNFQKPTRQQICRRLIGIAQKEHLQIDERTLETLLDSVQCDIRLALNHMQFIRNGSAVVSYDDTMRKAQERAKDVALSPFNAAERLLSPASKDISLENRINLVFQDADLVPLLIQENYINYCPYGERREDVRMNLLSKAADSICVGDMVNRVVRQQQRWDLMPLACIESAVTWVSDLPSDFLVGLENILRLAKILGCYLRRNCTFWSLGTVFPQGWVNTTSLHQVMSSQSITLMSRRNSLRLDYMSHLCRILVAPLREKEKEGVEQVVKTMEEYCLSREDRDALLEMSQLKGQKDLLEGIPAQVKSTFTRVLNQKISERSVKSSVMLADVKVRRGTAASTLAPDNAVDNDVVAADNEGEDMEEDSPEVSQEDITAIPGVRAKPANKSGATAHKTPKGQGRGGSGSGGTGKKQTRNSAKK